MDKDLLKHKLAIVQILLMTKKARLKCISNFIYNVGLQVEGELISAEINALGEEEKRILLLLNKKVG